MKEKLFKQLQDAGKIPADANIDHYTDELVIKMATENPSASGEKPRLTKEEFQELAGQYVDEKIKASGADKTDVKHLKLPGWEQALTDNEKKMLENPSKLTPATRRALANKQLRAIVAPFTKTMAGQITGQTMAIMPSEQNLALVNEGSNSEGLYTVPVEFIAEVSRLLVQFNVVPPLCNQFQASSKTGNKPKLLAATTGAYVTEQNAKTESNPTFDQIAYTRHDYAYISGVTKQLLQDSGVDIVGLLAELAAFDFGRNRDKQCILGTTLTDYILESGNGTVAITTPGSDPTATTNRNITDMLLGTAFGQNGEWLFHRTVLSLLLSLVDENNRPLYSLSDQLAIMSSKTFMGRPYHLVEVMQPVTGNNYLDQADDPVAGDVIALYGDWKKTCTFVNRIGFDIMVSDVATVGSASAFEKNLVFWRFEEAHDFLVEQGKGITKLTLGS